MNPNECVVLLTYDKLLRQAAENLRLAGKVSICEGIKEFWPHLKLLHDNKTKEYVDAILGKAPKVFYEKNNENCVYIKLNVFNEVFKKWDAELNNPQDPPFITPAPAPKLGQSFQFLTPAPATLPDIIANLTRKWKPASEEKVELLKTNLQDIKDDRTIWQTRLEFVRAFGFDGPSAGLVPFMGIDDRVRIAQIDVIWDAVATENGDLSDCKLLDILSAVGQNQPGRVE